MDVFTAFACPLLLLTLRLTPLFAFTWPYAAAACACTSTTAGFLFAVVKLHSGTLATGEMPSKGAAAEAEADAARHTGWILQLHEAEAEEVDSQAQAQPPLETRNGRAGPNALRLGGPHAPT